MAGDLHTSTVSRSHCGRGELVDRVPVGINLGSTRFLQGLLSPYLLSPKTIAVAFACRFQQQHAAPAPHKVDRLGAVCGPVDGDAAGVSGDGVSPPQTVSLRGSSTNRTLSLDGGGAALAAALACRAAISACPAAIAGGSALLVVRYSSASCSVVFQKMVGMLVSSVSAPLVAELLLLPSLLSLPSLPASLAYP